VELRGRFCSPREIPDFALSKIRIHRESFVPRIASAKKNMRKSRAAAERNRAQRATLRTAVKKASGAGATKADKTNATSLLDRAARKGLIHRNAAARSKSRLAK
jgi:small subunit ribosomal protein S20